MEQHSRFTFSIITRYEILRGLKAKAANKQLKAFEQFCPNNIILPLTYEIVVQAVDIYAELRKKGTPIGEADILIAASAMVNSMAIAPAQAFFVDFSLIVWVLNLAIIK
ncbi:PIN domain-containing protein [Scytonema sp. UIC 10036]|uniref:PIN domain-containing protein n=1 Tax=Scytonema sp. UIC 10036 TaxID=2304196 RepID=UPI001A9B5AB8|nr:PIN domain-containing protein [Scytonema sp. UIC 10036]